ncbi:MAG: single-stranded DNA-binding protein [Candidatus Margulisiibacteriota bacterium]
MASYNKIQLTGKLSDAPDVKATTSGHSLAKFTLIVPRIESLPQTRFDYIRVTTWRENADKAASFKKDDVIFVEGRIITDSYEDQSSGQRKWTTEVDARQVVNFNEVFGEISAAESTTSDVEPTSFEAPPIENLPIQPVDEAAFFKDQPVEESENDLEEDVPF